jgi:hypothetical protein
MSRHMFNLPFVDALALLGTAVVFLWLRVVRVSMMERCAQAALTVTGYLRPRPDPAAENALRIAFAELDRGLTEILGDRTPRDVLDS